VALLDISYSQIVIAGRLVAVNNLPEISPSIGVKGMAPAGSKLKTGLIVTLNLASKYSK